MVTCRLCGQFGSETVWVTAVHAIVLSSTEPSRSVGQVGSVAPDTSNGCAVHSIRVAYTASQITSLSMTWTPCVVGHTGSTPALRPTEGCTARYTSPVSPVAVRFHAKLSTLLPAPSLRLTRHPMATLAAPAGAVAVTVDFFHPPLPLLLPISEPSDGSPIWMSLAVYQTSTTQPAFLPLDAAPWWYMHDAVTDVPGETGALVVDSQRTMPAVPLNCSA